MITTIVKFVIIVAAALFGGAVVFAYIDNRPMGTPEVIGLVIILGLNIVGLFMSMIEDARRS